MDMKKNRPYLKPFAKYVSLNVLGMLGVSCYVLADTFFISKDMGEAGLTALNLALPVFSFIQAVALMLGVGGGIKYAVAKAEGKQKEANSIFSITLLLSGIFSVIFVLIGAFASRPITALLKANEEVFEMTNLYLSVVLYFSPAFIFNTVVTSFVRNDGNPRLAMLATLLGSLFNVVMDYVLIFPLHMGILGAVLATGVSPVLGLLITGFHWALKKGPLHITKTKIPAKTSFSILGLGLPSLVTEFSGGIVMIVFNSVILGLEGNVGVAAYGIVANIAFVVLSMYTGVAQGVQPLLSDAHGKKDLKAKDTLLTYSLVTVGCVSLLIYVLLACLNKPITALFNSDNNAYLAKIAELGMIIYFIGSVFASLNAIFSTYFASIEKPFPSQAITLLKGLILIIPFIYLFSFLFDMTGVWLAYVLAEAVTLVIAIIVYAVFRKRTKASMMLDESTQAETLCCSENVDVSIGEMTEIIVPSDATAIIDIEGTDTAKGLSEN